MPLCAFSQCTCILRRGAEWIGINALLYYGPTLVRALGLQGDEVTLVVSGGIGIVQFLAVLPAIVFIDRLGRKPLLRGKKLRRCCCDMLTSAQGAAS